ncbi:ATP-binding protein [Streptomyces formicae]
MCPASSLAALHVKRPVPAPTVRLPCCFLRIAIWRARSYAGRTRRWFTVFWSRQRRFARARSSVGAARAFAHETLSEWGITDRLDDVRLCVSELATNAVLHGVPPGREFCLALTADGGSIRIEVRDSGGGCPQVVAGGAERCDGRGLLLVQAVSDDFGVVEHVPGKTVWATFKTGSTRRAGRGVAGTDPLAHPSDNPGHAAP